MTEPATRDSGLDVLIVSQPTSAGVAVCVRQLTEAAVADGHRVTVACPSSSDGPLADWVVKAGATHVSVDLVRSPALSDLGALWSLRGLARGQDIVHLNSSKAGAVGRVAVRSLGRDRPSIVFTPHAWSWLVGGRLAGVYRQIERVLARSTDAIVAVSDQEANQGQQVLGAAADRMVVIPNGVDRVRFSPDGAGAERDPTVPLIVCVGRLCEQKGQDVAIEALGYLQHATARLRFVGDGPDRERLEALAVERGVADRVEWVGEVDDTSVEYRSADVVVSPSRWEGMSLVFLEALASGSPVVVSDVFGSDVVRGAGMIVPPDQPRALADAVDSLLDDDEARRRLGTAARQRSASYDVEATLRANLDLWALLAVSDDTTG